MRYSTHLVAFALVLLGFPIPSTVHARILHLSYLDPVGSTPGLLATFIEKAATTIVWAITAIICVTIVVFVLKNQLRSLVDRVSSIGKGFFQTDLHKPPQQLEAPSTEPLALATSQPRDQDQAQTGASQAQRETFNEVLDFGVPTVVTKRKENIRLTLTRMAMTTEQTIDGLVHQLAVTGAELAAERVYRGIYGSQIFFLKALNTDGPAPMNQLTDFYERVRTRHKPRFDSTAMEEYYSFLTRNDLIEMTPSSASITIAGTEFLSWMAAQRLTEDKPF